MVTRKYPSVGLLVVMALLGIGAIEISQFSESGIRAAGDPFYGPPPGGPAAPFTRFFGTSPYWTAFTQYANGMSIDFRGPDEQLEFHGYEVSQGGTTSLLTLGTNQDGQNAHFLEVRNEADNNGIGLKIPKTGTPYLWTSAPNTDIGVNPSNIEIKWWFRTGGSFDGRPVTSQPPAPASGGALFFQINGAGKTQACVRFPTGAAQCFATEP